MCIRSIFKTAIGKIKTAMIDKKKLEKEINVLGSEIARAHVMIFALQELIEQSNINFNVYSKYIDFFYQTYCSYYNDLIHHISHLQDMSRDSLSIIKMLARHKESEDELSIEENNMLSQLLNHKIGKRVKIIRDKLGKAHLDGKVSINPDKEQRIYEQNQVTLAEIIEYLELLTRALSIISRRLDIPINGFLKPISPLNRQICKLFEELAAKDETSQTNYYTKDISRPNSENNL